MPHRRLRSIGVVLVLAGLIALRSHPRPAPAPAAAPPAIESLPAPQVIRVAGPRCTQTFDAGGVGLRYDRFDLGLALVDLRLGDQPLLDGDALRETPPTAEGADIVYRRGPVTERYTPRGTRVEQSFLLDRALEARRGDGDLTVRVSLRSPLPAVATRNRVEFRDARGRPAMTYGAATAIDASGRRRALDYALDGSDLVMTLPRDFVAVATFPLLVDPTIGLAPTALTFEAPEGGPNALPQEVILTNTSTGKMKANLATSAPWLAASKKGNGFIQPGKEVPIEVETDVAGLAPGTYLGTVTVTSAEADNSPQVVDVTLIVHATTPVPDPPTLEVMPAALTVEAAAGGPNPFPRRIQLRNGGGSTLAWTASILGGAGVSVNPPAGSLAPGAVQDVEASFDVVGAGLGAGTALRTIRFADPAASNSPQDVAVTINVHSAPAIETDPAQLQFSAGLGGPNPFPQNLVIRNAGGSTLAWSATAVGASPWLTLGTTAGSLAPGESQSVAVIADVSALAVEGTYQDSIQISGPGAATVLVPVTLDVDPAPAIDLSPLVVLFHAPVGGTAPAQKATLRNSGGGTLRWSLTDTATWLHATPTSGSLTADESVDLVLTIDTTGLAAGPYGALLAVTSLGRSPGGARARGSPRGIAAPGDRAPPDPDRLRGAAGRPQSFGPDGDHPQRRRRHAELDGDRGRQPGVARILPRLRLARRRGVPDADDQRRFGRRGPRPGRLRGGAQDRGRRGLEQSGDPGRGAHGVGAAAHRPLSPDDDVWRRPGRFPTARAAGDDH